MEYGRWYVVYGIWEFLRWYMEYSRWYIVYGIWGFLEIGVPVLGSTFEGSYDFGSLWFKSIHLVLGQDKDVLEPQ